MPGGKATNSGALVRRPNLRGVDIAEAKLLAYRLNGRSGPFKEPADIEGSVREALEVYIGSHLGTEVPTATERNKTLAKISAAANKLVQGKNPNLWRPKLAAAVRLLDTGGRDRLHKSLTAAARADPTATNGSIGIVRLLQLGDEERQPEPGDEWLIKRTAEIAAQRSTRQKAGDPFLFGLVEALAPLWSEVTGRTPLSEVHEDSVQTGAEDPVIEFPFAAWIDALVTSAVEQAQGRLGNARPFLHRKWEIRPGAVVRILRT